MAIPSEAELSNEIKLAAKKAIVELFKKYPEQFYYCSLITDGEAHAPILTAWSEEALERAISKEKNKDEARIELKWSYADSPYYSFGENYFDKVIELFSLRPQMSQKMSNIEWMDEYQLRLRAMESAMKQLDTEGLFGEGKKRLGIVINAEVMPPDYGNTERAYRLNPKEALIEWYKEIAEEQ